MLPSKAHAMHPPNTEEKETATRSDPPACQILKWPKVSIYEQTHKDIKKSTLASKIHEAGIGNKLQFFKYEDVPNTL